MRIILCLATLLLAAGAALASGDVTGRWQGTLKVQGNDIPGYLVLKQDGQQLSGTAGPSAEKQIEISKATVDGDRITIEAKQGDTVLGFELRLEDGQLKGNVLEDGAQVGTATFDRVK